MWELFSWFTIQFWIYQMHLQYKIHFIRSMLVILLFSPYWASERWMTGVWEKDIHTHTKREREGGKEAHKWVKYFRFNFILPFFIMLYIIFQPNRNIFPFIHLCPKVKLKKQTERQQIKKETNIFYSTKNLLLSYSSLKCYWDHKIKFFVRFTVKLFLIFKQNVIIQFYFLLIEIFNHLTNIVKQKCITASIKLVMRSNSLRWKSIAEIKYCSTKPLFDHLSMLLFMTRIPNLC